MNPEIRTYLNFKEVAVIGEINNGKSRTQPDEVKSIKQMLIEHTRGILPSSGSGGQPQYYPEEYGYIPDPRELDLSERKEMGERYAQLVQSLQEQQSQLIKDKQNQQTTSVNSSDPQDQEPAPPSGEASQSSSDGQ